MSWCGRALLVGLSTSALLGQAGCAGYGRTVRIVDGEAREERPIASRAYAAALTAAYLEARGQYGAALRSYREALSYDDESSELQLRVAKLTCLTDATDADDEFAEAVSLNPHYEPAWREWARCSLRRGQHRQALRFAREAQAVEPLKLSATEILVEALAANNKHEEALRQLVGHVATFPDDLRAWQLLLELAQKRGHAAWVRAASDNVDRLRPEEPAPLASKPLELFGRDSADAVRAIAGALNREDLRRARQLAIDARLTPVKLAFLAAERGHFGAALAQAKLVLDASPSNSDARIIALLASFHLGLRDEFNGFLDLGKAAPAPPSPDVSLLLQQLIASEIGADGVAAWPAENPPTEGL